MNRGAKVKVAGAGAMGLSCALALADAGCRVEVFDPADPFFANASGVAAGMLAPGFEAVLDAAARPHFDLLMASRNAWPSLAQRAGLTLERSGALAAGRTEWIAQLAGRFTTLGLHATDLPRNTAEALAPGLSPDIEAILMTREDWRLDARQALADLRRAADAAGVQFRQEVADGRGDADVLVVATGAAGGLAHEAPELTGLEPIKGHILQAACTDLTAVTVRGEGIYVTPTAAGLAIGATMETGVDDPAVDPARTGPLLAAGARVFPALAQAPHQAFAGVRAATPDGLPLVGPSQAEGVFLAVGARRNGWLLAPLAAQVIAAQVTGRDPGAYSGRLDPRRFTRPG
ncbi:NAD(P)/FAD-dependent oxidoreductase [Phenylobacterium deserti]|uniref:D-amino-acid oxidase n=1 Tax=Phenylobacterium deserti TaxID=1914756 RepID=A0A328A8D6_9CAUL|nr:FAD-dependent oxidoreductase [Phenylobacterium deserti]RAK50729.1 D-amino-acid oxidase [Phenylobacterium deserti]